MDNNNLNQQIIAQNEQTIAQQQTQQVVQQQVQNQQPVVYAQQPQVVYVQQPVQQKPSRGKGLGMGIPGLVLGITALFYAVYVIFIVFVMSTTMGAEMGYSSYYEYEVTSILLIVYGIIGFIFAIPGIILSCCAKKHLNSGITKAGIVLNIISIVILALMVVAGISLLMLSI